MKNGQAMKVDLLLDTHAWIWLVTGESRILKSEFGKVLLKQENIGFFLSSISLWEIAMLISKERLKLTMDTRLWLERFLKITHTSIIEIDPNIAVKSTGLDGFHGDPADRIIVATAILKKVKLVTADQSILKYCKSNKIEYIKI
jgi:PIN domain nuclease of toxin-antitoxin system